VKSGCRICGQVQARLGHIVQAVLDRDIVGPDPGNGPRAVNPPDAHPGIPKVTDMPTSVRLAETTDEAGWEVMRARCLGRRHASQLWPLAGVLNPC
jgi:hypothetical protein